MRTALLALVILTGVTEAAAEPELVSSPTGYLVPAKAIYARATIDDAGRPSSDARLGLGDVAEFGLDTVDATVSTGAAGRARGASVATADEPRRYLAAQFRIGVREDALFRHQPAVALGFRKTFERDVGDTSSRLAELHLALSVHAGAAVTLHAGLVLWDASLERDGEPPTLFHDQGVRDQLRPFGAVEVRASDRTAFLADLGWTPHLAPGHVSLAPVIGAALRHTLGHGVTLAGGLRAARGDVALFGQASFLLRPRRW